MTVCRECGKEVSKEFKYCPYCGKTLESWDKRNNRPRVLIDFDNCINTFTEYLLEVYNARTGCDLKIEDIKEYNLEKYIGQYGISIFREKGFFEAVPEKAGSVSALKNLIESKDYDVYIISACGSNEELEEKFKWFDKYLPEFNKNRIIRCKEKDLISGDVLIDDCLDNLDNVAPYMKGIVMDMPFNKENKKYPRINNLMEALPLLENMFYTA
ncbi:MAG: zinc-ribbon domain-containing protein [Erysipelotrichaceae bacterium]|nr:zinc-ribbon domain-containing protein [Erysipelotrichaceae bacterium]